MIGLSSMIGAGVFAAFGPAARAAGNALLIGLVIAAVVAYCNATSSAQLAALYPESGGTYVYGRQQLGEFWGFVAGWGFVIGKLASCAAMALTFGSYASPSLARPLAVLTGDGSEKSRAGSSISRPDSAAGSKNWIPKGIAEGDPSPEPAA